MPRWMLLAGWMMIAVTVVSAQNDTCPVLERAAVAESRVLCADLETGQACYGNSAASAELLDDSLIFRVPSDRVPLTTAATLETRIDANQYGIITLNTSAYSESNWQPLPLNAILLGDVRLANTGNEGVNVETITAPVIGSQGVNVRSGPTTEYRVLRPLFEGDLVKLTGRTSDETVYRVQLPDGRTGWIPVGAVDVDPSALPLVTIDTVAPDQLYAPYAAFSLQTGSSDARCAEAWESGLLLQSGAESPARLLVNDTELTVSGTLFLQAQPDEYLSVFVIDGQLGYAADTLGAGQNLRLTAGGEPQITSYELDRLAYLPTEMLPQYVYIGFDIDALITPVPDEDRSPIADVLVTDACVLTTGVGGANLRGGPGAQFPIRDVLELRETVRPIARANDAAGRVWYEIAQNLWVAGDVVVFGGDCLSLPISDRIPVPPPTPVATEMP